MRTVSQLLTNKKNWTDGDFGTHRIERVQTIPQGVSILEGARKMNEHHVGSLVVLDTFDRMIGIISERDILTRVVADQRDPVSTLIQDVMTRDVVSCDAQTPLTQVRSIMSEQRIRHIPVLEDGALVGMISIGDLNAACNADLNIEVKSMREYITQG